MDILDLVFWSAVCLGIVIEYARDRRGQRRLDSRRKI